LLKSVSNACRTSALFCSGMVLAMSISISMGSLRADPRS
jgi:hypothetical protein